MFRLSIISVLLIAFALHCYSAEEPGKCVVKLAGKTISQETHAILIPEKASPSEIYAAEELQNHLKLLTGQAISITKDDKNTALSFFIVGKCGILGTLNVKVDWGTLGKEGIFIKTVGPHLVLAGGQRGVLYASYAFLEEYLGVRWFTRDCMKYPKEGTFYLASIEKQYVPPFEYRDVYTYAAFGADGNGEWAVRNRLNGRRYALGSKCGGKIVYAGSFVHTFFNFLSPANYFKDHPEYFSEVDGKRQSVQLCLSNPDVEYIVMKGVKALLKKSSSANIVSVSQNDTPSGYCQCAKCKVINEEEGSPSGAILRFVNRIAEQIEKEYPNLAIDTLAYNYSRKPPKITRPRANVIVRMGVTPCSFSQPLETGAQNIAFRQDLEGWGKICKRLYIWDYITNFHHFLRPHPNLRVLKPNIQFFAKNGVKGVMAQGNASSPGGEMDELRTYLLTKLLWNPEADAEKLLNEFLNGYYGDAAPYIRQYIDMIHDSSEKTNTYLGMYGHDAYAPFLTTEIIAKSDELFKVAENAVRNDPVLTRRVQLAGLPLLYMHIAGCRTWRREGDKLLANSGNSAADIEKFEKAVLAAKITHLKEGSARNMEEWFTVVKSGISDFSIRTLRNPVIEIDILPEFGGRILQLKYLPENKVLINPLRNKKGFLIDQGGYEEYSTNGYRSPGWNEKYEIIESDDTKLVLMVNLKNGFQMKRSFSIDPEKPILNITSILTNLTDKTSPSVFRIHPVFTVGDIRQSVVKLKAKDGTLAPFSLADDKKMMEGIYFEKENMPDGEWMFFDGENNIGMINHFQPGDVSKCYLNWSTGERRINMEMWSSKTDLKPGASLTVRHSYEIFNDRRPQ